jgi:hypothetical protein
MSTINAGLGRAIAGVGGGVLIASLWLPWADTGGENLTGWETLQVWDVFVLITGVCGLVAALTGGRHGFFRPDISFNAMTDMFGVVLGTLLAWMVLFDFPSGAGREAGVYVALVGAWVVATGAGDFRPPSIFPRRVQAEHRPAGT